MVAFKTVDEFEMASQQARTAAIFSLSPSDVADFIIEKSKTHKFIGEYVTSETVTRPVYTYEVPTGKNSAPTKEEIKNALSVFKSIVDKLHPQHSACFISYCGLRHDLGYYVFAFRACMSGVSGTFADVENHIRRTFPEIPVGLDMSMYSKKRVVLPIQT